MENKKMKKGYSQIIEYGLGAAVMIILASFVIMPQIFTPVTPSELVVQNTTDVNAIANGSAVSTKYLKSFIVTFSFRSMGLIGLVPCRIS